MTPAVLAALMALGPAVSPVAAQEAWWEPSPRAEPRAQPGTARETGGGFDAGSQFERAQGPRGSSWPPSGARGAQSEIRSETRRPAASGVDRIERSDLAPVTVGDGSGLPYDAWGGLSLPEVAELSARIVLPPRSPALKAIWGRLMTSGASVAGEGSDLFEAFRLDSLSRSGLSEALLEARPEGGTVGPGQVVLARVLIAEGRAGDACEGVRQFGRDMARLPDLLKREALMLRGACALVAGDASGAGLVASILRDRGSGDQPGLPALDAGTFGEPRTADGPAERWGVADLAAWLAAGGRVGDLAGDPQALGDALLFIARAGAVDMSIRVQAAENAARRNILSPGGLAEVYTAAAGNAGDAGGSGAASLDGRVAAFARAAGEVTPFQKVRAIRGFLDVARQAGLYTHALAMMDGPARGLRPAAELSWFAETAVEIALVAGDTQRARDWIAASERADPVATGNLDHWAALADILDAAPTAERSRALQTVEAMALDGRFGAEALHKLATVLDALAIHVPIPLWEAASRTPQPTGGHLPETGLLSRLQEASRKKAFAETVLLAIQAIGPGTAAEANLIALGDTIRALRRAGHERDARALAFEALFAVWPRRTSG